MKPIRKFLESIAFAGMKPGARSGPKAPPRWLGPLLGPIEKLMYRGMAPADPLYLSNRTGIQKLKAWSILLVPCLILVVVVAYGIKSRNPPEAKPVKEPTAAEISAKLLPNLNNDIKLAPAPEVRLLEIHIEGSRLIGVVQNTSTREIGVVKMTVDLTNDAGSQVGAVTVTLERVPPSSEKRFDMAIRQRNAAYALVREITTP